MRFFTDDGGRSTTAGWTWRSTAAVMSLALVSSLAVGIAAAGGMSVLDRPSATPPAAPPLADSSPPEPLPLDVDPPPAPEPAGPAEAAPPRDTAPAAPLPVTTEQVESAPETAPAPEAVEDTSETVTGTWTAVEDTLDLGEMPALELPSSTQFFVWEEGLCPQGEPESFAPGTGTSVPSGESWTPSWDTEYPAHYGYERLSHRPCDPYRRNCRIAVTSP